jgi:hypothetical protein
LFRVPVTVDISVCPNTWREKQDIEIAAEQPPQDMLDKMDSFNIWESYFK